MATPLPPTTDFTGENVTQGGFKAAFSSLRTYLAELFGQDGAKQTARKTLGVPRNATVVKTASYTATAADCGSILRFTGSTAMTLNLTAAVTLGDGWTIGVVNDSTATVTIDPYLAETINNVAPLDIPPGIRIELVCDGTRFHTPTSAGVTSVNCMTGAVTVTNIAGNAATANTVGGVSNPIPRDVGALGIGCFIIATTVSGSVAPNATAAGSNLREMVADYYDSDSASQYNPQIGTTALSGTWRNVGTITALYSSNNDTVNRKASMFQRIA